MSMSSLTAKFTCKFTFFAYCAYTAYISYSLFPWQPKEGRVDFQERQADWPQFSEPRGQLALVPSVCQRQASSLNTWEGRSCSDWGELDRDVCSRARLGRGTQLAAGWKKWLAQQRTWLQLRQRRPRQRPLEEAGLIQNSWTIRLSVPRPGRTFSGGGGSCCCGGAGQAVARWGGVAGRPGRCPGVAISG